MTSDVHGHCYADDFNQVLCLYGEYIVRWTGCGNVSRRAATES
jgi:hypothetical protein